MAYIEHIPTRRHFYVLLALFPLLYLVNLGTHELRRQEALLATVASEMGSSTGLLATTAHGEHVDAFPMYPMMVRVCSGFRQPNEFTARLPAALAVLAMAVLCGRVAARSGGRIAGMVAAGVVLTAVVCLREGVRAGSDTVFGLLIAGAWFAWFRLGREKRRWALAWAVSLALVAAATLTVGLRAVAWFYLPLCFLRMPLRAWRRMLLPVHFVALGGFAVFIILWVQLVPGQ